MLELVEIFPSAFLQSTKIYYHAVVKSLLALVCQRVNTFATRIRAGIRVCLDFMYTRYVYVLARSLKIPNKIKKKKNA